jgi:hypothetical protein
MRIVDGQALHLVGEGKENLVEHMSSTRAYRIAAPPAKPQ